MLRKATENIYSFKCYFQRSNWPFYEFHLTFIGFFVIASFIIQIKHPKNYVQHGSFTVSSNMFVSIGYKILSISQPRSCHFWTILGRRYLSSLSDNSSTFVRLLNRTCQKQFWIVFCDTIFQLWSKPKFYLKQTLESSLVQL